MKRYKLQTSVDSSENDWKDSDQFFSSKKEVDEFIEKMTPSGILDWRVGWLFKLRPIKRDSEERNFYRIIPMQKGR